MAAMVEGWHEEVDEAFKLYFNRRRQYVSVYFHEVSPQTFHRRGGGRWAYYIPAQVQARHGKFGELHFVSGRVRHDVVAHELFHLLMDRMRVRNMTVSDRTEERLALMMDELTRAFWREYGKFSPQKARRTLQFFIRR
jgi:hypothetical protein